MYRAIPLPPEDDVSPPTVIVAPVPGDELASTIVIVGVVA